METLKSEWDTATVRTLHPMRQGRLSNHAGYGLAAGVIALGLFASITPSLLYRTYSVLWHFSPLTLTLIYATYGFGVLSTLLLAGGVSDDVCCNCHPAYTGVQHTAARGDRIETFSRRRALATTGGEE